MKQMIQSIKAVVFIILLTSCNAAPEQILQHEVKVSQDVPSEVFITDDLDVSETFRLSKETFSLVEMEKIDILSAQKSEDGNYQFFVTYTNTDLESEQFLVEGTLEGNSFSILIPSVNHRIAFDTGNQAYLCWQKPVSETNDFQVWDCDTDNNLLETQ